MLSVQLFRWFFETFTNEYFLLWTILLFENYWIWNYLKLNLFFCKNHSMFLFLYFSCHLVYILKLDSFSWIFYRRETLFFYDRLILREKHFVLPIFVHFHFMLMLVWLLRLLFLLIFFNSKLIKTSLGHFIIFDLHFDILWIDVHLYRRSILEFIICFSIPIMIRINFIINLIFVAKISTLCVWLSLTDLFSIQDNR